MEDLSKDYEIQLNLHFLSCHFAYNSFFSFFFQQITPFWISTSTPCSVKLVPWLIQNLCFVRTNIYINPPVAPPLVGGYGFGYGVPFYGGWGWSPFSFFAPGPSVAIGVGGGFEVLVLFLFLGAVAAVIRRFAGSKDEDDDYYWDKKQAFCIGLYQVDEGATILYMVMPLWDLASLEISCNVITSKRPSCNCQCYSPLFSFLVKMNCIQRMETKNIIFCLAKLRIVSASSWQWNYVW